MSIIKPASLPPNRPSLEELARMSAKQEASKADRLLDAMRYGMVNATPEPLDLKTLIERAKKEHQMMLATLEWFEAHIKLDEPSVHDTAVHEIIMAGLSSILERRRNR